MPVRALLWSLLVLSPANAVAFGPLGHRLVAALAEERLSPPTRAELERLLGEGVTLAAVSTWADELRDRDAERGRATARWHFVNIPREAQCRYDEARDCPEGQCIVAALERQAALLADRRTADPIRREALKWVVHLVGDIHQPLHAGYPEDRGGNLFQVHYLGRGSNLHALWDSGLLESARRNEDEYLERLRPAAASIPTALTAYRADAARRWAEESCALLASLPIYPPRAGRLPRGYLKTMRPHVEERVLRAGLRLAELLEHALAPPSARHPLGREPAR